MLAAGVLRGETSRGVKRNAAGRIFKTEVWICTKKVNRVALTITSMSAKYKSSPDLISVHHQHIKRVVKVFRDLRSDITSKLGVHVLLTLRKFRLSVLHFHFFMRKT